MPRTITLHNAGGTPGEPTGEITAKISDMNLDGERSCRLRIYFGYKLIMTVWDNAELDTTLALFDALGIAVQELTIRRNQANADARKAFSDAAAGVNLAKLLDPS